MMIITNTAQRACAGYSAGSLHRSNIYPLTEHIADVDDELGNSRKKINLLVIDDDDVDRERIKRYISKFRLPVTALEAGSGMEAIECLSRDSVDLILLDYQLGDMTGTELLARLENSQYAGIPAIMITGMGDEKTAVEAIRFGVFDYLPKSKLTAESLIAVLESALRASELEKKLHETQQRLQHMSLYDSLTGLPNRNLFFDRLDQAILNADRNKSGFSVLMIDLNLFKEVNDCLGHAAGDEVLAVIGDRLQTSARKSDTFARLGGDEFVCILHGVHETQDDIACAEKIISKISEPIAIHDRVIQTGASVGIARYPAHGRDATSLLSNADSVMYRAKKDHRKYLVYNDNDTEQNLSKIPVTQYLHKGIKARELFLEYQPKIDLYKNQVVGAEVLVRWRSPKFGLIMPGDFIPIAERSSLIEDLTYATMEMAFDQLQLWRQEERAISLAINVSARMLDDRKMPDWLAAELKQRQIAAGDITLEITETTLASSGSCAHQILHDLVNIGFDVSIDDFGSGFTSFRSIRDMQFAELKIDRLFIQNIQTGNQDASIVRSMILLAESLGMRSVAEGVETEEQWNLLQQLGCQYGQGFGIARPMPAHALINWLAEFSTRV
ncbi:MAG: EAL domain-containing protein [Chromatiales bacterium]|jgi:diguanylate cyclase (GGDEF)-like protein